MVSPSGGANIAKIFFSLQLRQVKTNAETILRETIPTSYRTSSFNSIVIEYQEKVLMVGIILLAGLKTRTPEQPKKKKSNFSNEIHHP